jgi:methyl-accepting chemotaxis protein
MQEIVSSVQRVTDIMGEITAASVEQSAGIDQVNSAITSMDEVTQQNAALVEQAAAAAESLVEQSVSLTETVSAFRLSGSNGYAAKQLTKSKPSASRAVASRPATNVAKSATTSRARRIVNSGVNEGDWEEF